MNKLSKALTYSFHRNIGWLDRTIRTVVGTTDTAVAIHFYQSNLE